MNKKYVMVSLEDPKMKKLSEVLGNKTCKKIIDLLAEKEATKGDIAKMLKLPLNTVTYNVEKLVEAGLIEKSKDYFWSIKGKKICVYKLSNKSIVISPKLSHLKSVLISLGLSGIITALIGIFNPVTFSNSAQEAILTERVGDGLTETAKIASETVSITNLSSILSQPWLWFLFGAIFMLILVIILNRKK